MEQAGTAVAQVASSSVREFTVDRSWWSWEGAHGGSLVALALEAMRDDVVARSGTDRSARTINAHFLRPVDERPFRLTGTVEHAGRGSSVASFRAAQEGAPVLFGSAVFGARRPGPDEAGSPAPTVPPPDRCDALALPAGLVAFGEHLEIRPAGPNLPLSGAADPELLAWIRFADRRALDAAAVVILADALPPALFARWTRPRAAPSAELTVHFGNALDDGPVSGWALVRMRTEHAGNGWALDDSAVWTADGRLLALGRQARRILADRGAPDPAGGRTRPSQSR
ncbi:acyl-CoA thioesterase [Embleya sp. NPDC059237]|uniref:acyl-CoA thioesterase n=1 Tax=Embleya sp. NPDC059237 TaxID=3346784 RepID=UPI0036B292B1